MDIQIFVVNSGEPTIIANVKNTTTINQLKEIIIERYDIPLQLSFYLLFEGKPLRKINNNLRYYNIKNESNIFLNFSDNGNRWSKV
jgi:hypothetical protein